MCTGVEFGRPIEILLVEDSPTDAELTKEALAEGKLRNNISHVEDGVEALAYLRKQGEYANVVRPDMVLLDLNMPRKDGREVLREIRTDPELKGLLVVVLTTSQDEKDVLTAYGLQTNAYLTKPVDLDEFFTLIHHMTHFWFRVVTLPPNCI